MLSWLWPTVQEHQEAWQRRWCGRSAKVGQPRVTACWHGFLLRGGDGERFYYPCWRQCCAGSPRILPDPGTWLVCPVEGAASVTDATHLTVLQFLAAEIESMWQDQQGDMWAECRWWYFPEETRGGRRPEFGSR